MSSVTTVRPCRAASASSSSISALVGRRPSGLFGFVRTSAFDLGVTARSSAAGSQFPTGTKYGTNSAGKTGWTPPCPPEGDDPHHYVFTMYSLKDATGLADGADPDAVKAKLKGAVASGSFTGTYKR